MGRLPPDCGLSNKKCSEVKGSKVWLTYLLVSNADGSEKQPPLIIGKAKKPQAFKNQTGTQLGFNYRNNAKAWMTGGIYQEWLQQWDRELGGRGVARSFSYRTISWATLFPMVFKTFALQTSN